MELLHWIWLHVMGIIQYVIWMVPGGIRVSHGTWITALFFMSIMRLRRTSKQSSA